MVITLPACTVDLETGEVRRPGGPRRLTTRELALLRYLVERPGATVDRTELLREVWGYADAVHSRATDGAVRRLREKIEVAPSAPTVVLSVFGSGYRFVSPEAAGPVEADSPPPTLERRRFRLGVRRVDLDRAAVEAPDGVHDLTANELALLEVLWAAGGRAIDRETLARRVWGSAAGRALPNAVHRLRRKLEDDPTAPVHLLSTATGLRLELFPQVALPPRPRPQVADASFGHSLPRAALAEALTEARSVVVVGAAGAGKTRLVLETLGDRVTAFVDLAALESPCDLDTLVADALGIRAETDLPGRLRDRLQVETWVVFDHAQDHVVETLAWWRRHAGTTAARIIVTSRVALRLGQARIDVGPLEPSAAAALFEDRAGRPLDPAERAQLPELVALLDHLPFAVEVAAARGRVLSVRDLLERLQEVLQTPGPDVLGHARSVLASLESVVRALPTEAVRAYQLLGVCAGAVDLPAVEALLGAGAVDLLAVLVDSRLVRRVGTGFVLPPLVREHARRSAGDTAAALTLRHAQVFADRARQAPDLVVCTEEYAVAALRIADAAPPLALACALAALEGFTHAESADRAAALVDALADQTLPPAWVGYLRARTAQARGDLGTALQLASRCVTDDPELAVRVAILRQDLARLGVGEMPLDALAALVHASTDASVQALGQLALAAVRRDVVALTEAARAVFRHASPHDQLKAAELVANRFRDWRALREAAQWVEVWSALAVRHRSPRSEARAHVFTAWLANAGVLPEGSDDRLERAAEVQRAIGDRSGLVQTLFEIAASRRARGDVAAAEVKLREALALARGLPMPKAVAVVHWNLFQVLRERGEAERAWDHAHVALAVATRTGDVGLARIIQRDTLVAWIEDGEAARAAARARELLASPVDAWDTAMLTLRLAEAKAALGEDDAAQVAVDAASQLEAQHNPRLAARALAIARSTPA